MKRRELFVSLGGTVAAWPLSGGAQPSQMRRIGVLFVYGEDHLEAPSVVTAIRNVFAASAGSRDEPSRSNFASAGAIRSG
jgi:hypothetical protein